MTIRLMLGAAAAPVMAPAPGFAATTEAETAVAALQAAIGLVPDEVLDAHPQTVGYELSPPRLVVAQGR